MDTGRAVLGVSAAGALVLAVGLGIVVAPGQALATDTVGGSVCGTFPEGSTSATGWFLTSLRNDSDHGVRVLDVRVKGVHAVDLSHLAIAPHPAERTSGLTVTEDAGTPADFGRTVPIASGYVVPAHRDLTVVGRFVLRPGASEGWLEDVVVTTAGPLWTKRTAIEPGTFGVAIDQGQDDAEVGCPGD